eukprot:CAMPEP_0185748876 /NCGR_PEP_ID=MMETSP1174-20130828/7596_1 /TAXON_ID=35687 /ORGANISM="Dictyocha speculum, Strain CCMP1381" /LENGTH=615 /DNA_ID=CAMNT_0028424755 /DNA_START=6 /DNA_END=1853 /DNA_ORIENTATION=+
MSSMRGLQSGIYQAVTSVSTRKVRQQTILTGSRGLSTVKRPQLNTPVKNKNLRVLKVPEHGVDILHDSLWNKGLAFSDSERDRFGLRGLLPPVERPLKGQRDRAMAWLRSEPDDTKKNIFLQELHHRNETLYHRLIVEYIEELAPLVYTPTVGTACLQFGNQYRTARGMYFAQKDRGMFSTMIHNWPHDDVHVIVVTDGSRILGLGDLGVHGMGIPIGKLALYCAAGGIAPHRVMPVMLDVGTNNPELIDDPNYLGTKMPRLTGDEYFDFVDEFMHAVFSRYPETVVQFEDFETPKAVPLLEKYRNEYRCFNDDIQGTGCVTLAGLLSAVRNADASVKDLRVVCAGAGSAGLGVCQQIVYGMVEAGLSHSEAMSRFVIITSQGALGKADGAHGDPNHSRGLGAERLPWVNEGVSDGADMLDAVKEHGANCLLGLSTVPGIFTKDVVQACAANHERPIIMPMSNPTNKSECTPAQAYEWTDGRAVVSTGSPFKPVQLADGQTLIPSQCNNMYVFPGIGLAASVAGVKTITDKMLYLAAVACSESMTQEEIDEGRTFPAIARIRDVSHTVACAIIAEAMKQKLTTKIDMSLDEQGISDYVTSKMYYPQYIPLVQKRR